MIARIAALAAALAWAPAVSAQEPAAPDHVEAPRNPTEAALIAAVHRTCGQQAFEDLFMDTTVFIRIEPETYAALQQAKAEGRASFDGLPMQLWAVEPQPGVRALGVYLSERGFNNHHAGHHWVSLPGRAALGLAKHNGLGVWVTDAGLDGQESDGHSALWGLAELDLVLARNPAEALAPR